jgi:alpha/beta superfamily hydrolase
VRLHTTDGLDLEAEWSAPAQVRATAVLCHPHPQYGGTMRSLVISALFEALPARGVGCLRFNFRGVENSEGEYSEGRDEPLDILAALDAAATQGGASGGGPLALVGWSFGADMALGIVDSRIAGWAAIAPPLRFRPASAYRAVGDDPRPKLLVLAANDEFRAPQEIAAEAHDWTATRLETVAGASHFFIGRTERVVAFVDGFVDALIGSAG